MWQSTWGEWWLTHWASLLRWILSWWFIRIPKLTKQMRSGIVHHKSDRKSCVIPTADRNTFHFLPTGLHGLCFGFCFSGPLPLRSLPHGPLLRVHFGESLVLDYTQKSTISTLAVKLSVSAIIYPRWTATYYTRFPECFAHEKIIPISWSP